METGLPHRKVVVAFSLFVAGLLVTLAALSVPSVRALFSSLEHSGITGAFIGGVLYTSAFTAASASVILANLPDTLNPFMVAFVAALGSMAYDMIVFFFFQKGAPQTFAQRMDSLLHRHRIPTWATTVAGFLLLASPLPDELAIGLLSGNHLSARRFLPLSFAANFLGPLVIVLLGHG